VLGIRSNAPYMFLMSNCVPNVILGSPEKIIDKILYESVFLALNAVLHLWSFEQFS
jgi:hypothetical protein